MKLRAVCSTCMAAGSLLLAGSSAAADKRPNPHVYGPPPNWEEYRQIGEAAITAQLIDPESARITWLTGMFKGEVKPFLSPRVSGYWACGTVNAKNRLGGYTGAHTFLIAIDYGRVFSTNVDTRTGGMFDEACAKFMREGLFPPVPGGASDQTTHVATEQAPASHTAQAPAPAAPLANVSTGLALSAMPDGAYVSAVVPGSPAAIAGLKPGMVIGSVNAVPLAGMGDTMLKVIDAAGATAQLAVIGGGTHRLGAGK